MTGREEFGPGLRRERERRGISLEQVAAKTKIAASLFAAMERNDFSRWPNGIFRRSFLRAYAEVVGLDADELVQRFLRLFPSHEDPLTTPPAPRVIAGQPSPQPQAAATHHRERGGEDGDDEQPARPRPPVAGRVAATLADVGLIALLSGTGWLIGGWFGMGPATVLGGLLIFVVGNVLLGKTPGAWLLGGERIEPAPPITTRPAAAVKRAVADERVAAKRRSTLEPHQAARRHTVRRLDRSRSRRA
ncbi:MAG: helix-turn-helix domain-containing protein [Bacteroidales bacterium]